MCFSYANASNNMRKTVQDTILTLIHKAFYVIYTVHMYSLVSRAIQTDLEQGYVCSENKLVSKVH